MSKYDDSRRQANKARNVAAEARKQARDALLRPARLKLRKIGALRRIDRRIAAANDNPALTVALRVIRAKVAAAAA